MAKITLEKETTVIGKVYYNIRKDDEFMGCAVELKNAEEIFENIKMNSAKKVEILKSEEI